MADFSQQHQQVGTQLNAETINLYLSEHNAAKRKTWRPLYQLAYDAYRDDEARRSRFLSEAALALHETCCDSGYTAFSSLFHVQQDTEADDGAHAYVVTSHQSKFLAALQRLAAARAKDMEDLRRRYGDADAETQLRNVAELNEKRSAEFQEMLGDWNLSLALNFAIRLNAFDVIYDPDIKMIKLEPSSTTSLDPADYREHLDTTSELMQWIGAQYNATMRFVGDLEWSLKSYRLYKLMAYVLDHNHIDPGAVRTEVNDPESWDYNYPQIEEELRSRRKPPAQPST